jgi:hypothetical protein
MTPPPPLVDRLPFETRPLPQKDRWIRPAVYIGLLALLVGLILRFHRGTVKQIRKAEQARAAGSTEQVKQPPSSRTATRTARGATFSPGSCWRWRSA